MSDATNHDIFIARQPILDKNLEIFGYELFSRSNQAIEKSDIKHTPETDAEMLFNIVSTFDVEQLLNGRIAFLNCTLDTLTAENFEFIDSKYVVLEIKKPHTYDAELIEKVTENLKELKRLGYGVASDDFIFEETFKEWVPYISFIKLQANNDNEHNRKMLFKSQSLHKKIIAELVETQEQFQFFTELKADFFQGYFFFKPVTLSAKITNPTVTTISRLINLLVKESSVAEIESVLKTDPALSYRLLRYINSSSFGLRTTVNSFKHAVMMVGYQRLFKWLTLLLSNTHNNPGANAVAKVAIARGRFMELLGEKVLSKGSVDHCFVVGMFSLLDVMLNVSLETALKSIDLYKPIVDALLHQSGEYYPLLQLTIALEQNNWMEILSISSELGLSPQEVTEYHLNALEWTSKLNLDG